MPISEQLPIEKIIRQDRRTVSIQVTDDAKIIIKVPRHASTQDIEQVLEQHIRWIQNRLTRARQGKQWTQRKFTNGEKFLYLGHLYQLKLIDTHKAQLVFKDNAFYLEKNINLLHVMSLKNGIVVRQLRIFTTVCVSMHRC